MKAILLSLLSIALATTSALANARETLRILIWEEYLSPQVVEAFERRSGAAVEQINYQSETTIIPLLDENTGRIDLVVGAASSTMPTLAAANRLQPLDTEKLPNTRAIHSLLQQDSVHLVPYMWGTTGIAWRTDLLPDPPDSWAGFVQLIEDNPGKVGVIDDMVEMLLMMHFALGNDGPFDSIEQVEAAIERATPLLEMVVPVDSDLTENHPLLQGELIAIQTWNGDVAYLRDSFEAPLDYRVPEKGCKIWQDTFAIPSDAPNPDLAHDFLNYINLARVAARNAEYIRFAPSNPMSLAHVDISFLQDPIIRPNFEDMGHCHIYVDYPEEIQALIDDFQEQAGWH